MEGDNDEPMSLRRSTRRSLPVSINNVDTESTPTKGNAWKRSNMERRSEDSMKSKRIKLEKLRSSRPPSMSQSHCSDDDLSLPVRRSAREKRLVFANFTPQEITRTINQTAAIQMVATESSDEDMEPYERLLSPVNKKGPRKRMLAYHLRCHGAVRNQEEEKEQEEKEKEQEEKRPEGGSNAEEPEASEEEEEEEEGEEEEETSYYNLRKRRPIVYQYQPVLQVVDNQPRPERRNRQVRSTALYRSVAHSSYYSSSRKNNHTSSSLHHKAHQNSSTSSSEDSDEARFQRRKSRSMRRARNECLPMNFTHEDAMSGPIRDRARIGASLADVSPMNIDQSISFDDIGGLKQHIRSLKEMIIFPLLYPEVFQRFKITPPRGVIFHGPPGCGKTLVARALANECSKGGRKVAFFMRKGADCLSKWVGESERQLRLLFDQAYQMRPSIIFFDEIDGLAPVRSSRQDQIHSSIVSTLLALMDGVDSRGEIVIIGATNRIDAIDPALRRPGRFDREFVFPLPSREDRSSILHIHTQHWDPPLRHSFLSELAEHTVGYCGADLRALCTEAALFSLRRQYPQIYATSDKLVIDPTKINISAADFYSALKSIVPTTQRTDSPQAHSLCDNVFPLLGEQFLSLLSYCAFIFPQSWNSVCRSQQEIRSRLGREKEKEIERTSMRHCGSSEMSYIRPAQSIPLSCNKHTQEAASSLSSTTYMCTADMNCRQVGTTRSSNSSVLPYHAAQQSLPLRDIFFDSSHALSDCGSMDILVRGSASSADHVTSGFLTLSSNPHMPPLPHRPRLLLAGQKGGGQSDHIAPALLHTLEEFPLKTLDLNTLFGSSVRLPEEACTQVFREAQRVAPAVLYIPRVDAWWSMTSDTFRATFTYCILSLPSFCPLLILCTAETLPDELPDELYQLFSHPPPPTLSLSSLTQRQNFFHHVMLIKPLQSPPNIPLPDQEAELEPLPVAPPLEPRELSQEETEKLYRQREAVLRELRVFLREATNKLLAERKFKEFTKPVDREEVQDYYDIIRHPMDLSTVMRKIDDHRYSLPRQWLHDVNLITKNALEYNPEHDLESRLLRHRAVALQDLAHSIFDHELSEEFEKQCEDIKSTLVRLGKEPPEPALSPCDHTHSTPASSHSHNVSDSALFSSEPIRRSLRRLGVKPDTTGLPYYAPAKPRTPRKDSNTSQQIGQEEVEVVEEETSSRRQSIDVSASPPVIVVASAKDLHSSSSPQPVTDHISVAENECKTTAMRRLEFTPPIPEEDKGVEQSDTGQTATDARSDTGMIENETTAVCSDMEEGVERREVIIDKQKMMQLFEETIEVSSNWSVEQMIRLHSTLEQLAFRHRLSWDRTGLLEDYKTAIQFC